MFIPLGVDHEENLLVTEEMAISFLGPGAARVLSTPHLIGFLEMTARNLIKKYVEPGEDSGGTVVNVRHLAATPIGMQIRLGGATVSEEGRSVLCRGEG